jgi:hypothetical protein
LGSGPSSVILTGDISIAKDEIIREIYYPTQRETIEEYP